MIELPEFTDVNIPPPGVANQSDDASSSVVHDGAPVARPSRTYLFAPAISILLMRTVLE